jgi:hypothetical protein
MKAFGGFRYTNYSYSDSYIGSFNIDNDKMPNMDTSNQFKTYGGANDKWTNLGYYANFRLQLQEQILRSGKCFSGDIIQIRYKDQRRIPDVRS